MAEDRRRLQIGVAVDFRNSPFAPRSLSEVYNEVVDAVVWCEQAGFDYVWPGEHHFGTDGYATNPLMLAAAIAMRTHRITLSSAVMLLPLYDPVRVAEDGAMVDIFSNGRFELGVGSGRRQEEYDGFGIPMKSRGKRMDEQLEIITRLWSGEDLTFEGEHFRLRDLHLDPLPVQRPRPRIWVGGGSKPSLRRAARFADGFVVTGCTEQLHDDYCAALQAEGKDPASALIWNSFRWMLISRDPKKMWDEVAPYIMAWVNYYAAWGTVPGVTRVEDLQKGAPHYFEVVTPDEAGERINDQLARVPCWGISLKLGPPGYPIERGKEHLELFLTDVLPHLQH